MNKLLLQTIVDEEGRVQNFINHLEILNQDEDKAPDVYFCFLLKTLIDDFGLFLNATTKISQEQFEARLMENLNGMLAHKTCKQ